MQLDILNLGTPETQARVLLNHAETLVLMEACQALRDARFPGVLDKLPRMFDEEDLARVVGNEEDMQALMGILEAEQAFHQALHLFPEGHAH
ncbi:MAG TPA: hypothetical protein V6D47_01775 [Oscillatoriaceae cyanobacterium]